MHNGPITIKFINFRDCYSTYKHNMCINDLTKTLFSFSLKSNKNFYEYAIKLLTKII
jgi:hypothetical protein